MKDQLQPGIYGHILIKDSNGNVLVDKSNAINYENMSVALAKGIANKSDGFIAELVFGNGASSIDNTGTYTYLPPNVIGASATLYNETYSKIVDDNNPLNADPDSNKIVVSHEVGNFYTDFVVYCTLTNGEPSGQEAVDQASNTTGDYVFDEVGVRDVGGNMLTHVIFNPVQKSLNRTISIQYTIRITVQ